MRIIGTHAVVITLLGATISGVIGIFSTRKAFESVKFGRYYVGVITSIYILILDIVFHQLAVFLTGFVLIFFFFFCERFFPTLCFFGGGA